MNFLAHAYLSGDDPDLLFGNFVADSIKGKTLNTFESRVRDGVLLHRAIDTFTDNHPVVRLGVTRLQPDFRKFSGVILDIYFDHFLAMHWKEYNQIELKAFASHVYWNLLSRYYILPPRTKRILPWMMAQDWLVGYANLNDLQRVFNGMSRRTNFNSGMENAVDFLMENYAAFETDFRIFFPELRIYAADFIDQIGNRKA
ncbi:MAG: DUF479 domain-containing protein [Bacteroidetes bacterium HGW-Bacteroidetes-1]|nr:MAG: DUF479 domain-containing protein [Bacteroidetes bacterium HGW-Bacteroidetes-1]